MPEDLPSQRGELLKKVRERIFAYASSRIGRDDAEDLAQDTLMVLQSRYADKTQLTDLVPLGIRIMQFKLRAHRRKTGSQPSEDLEGLYLPDGTPDPEEQAAFNAFRNRIEAKIAGLGSRCQDIFLMKLQGLNFQEIMVRLGEKNINTIYVWDLRCRRKLLELIKGGR